MSLVPERWFSFYQTMLFPSAQRHSWTNAVVGRGTGVLHPASSERRQYPA